MDFLLFVYLHVCFGICMSSEVCSKNARATSQAGTFYYTKYFCCSHHEQHGMGCKKCPVGFTSTAGSQCVPCSGGTFGNRCVDKCNCKRNQRCDNVYGCVSMIQTYMTNQVKEAYYKSTVKKSDYISSAAATIFGNFDTSIEEQNVTEYAVIKHIRPKDSSNHHILKIFLFGVIFVIICLVVSGALLYWKRLKTYSQRANSSSQMNSNVQANNTESENLDNYNNFEITDYEEIEEMLDGNSFVLSSNRTDSSSSESSDTNVTLNDGYIYPYQQLIPTVNDVQHKQNFEYSKLLFQVYNKADNPEDTYAGCMEVEYLDLEYFSKVYSQGKRNSKSTIVIDKVFSIPDEKRRNTF